MVSRQPSEKECTNQFYPEWETTRKMLKANKEEAGSLKVSPTCTTSYLLFGCRRSRRNLTEVMLANCFPDLFIYLFSIIFISGFVLQAEKEERRIRRILANRESARQTIRRRQVQRISIQYGFFWFYCSDYVPIMHHIFIVFKTLL